MKKFVILLSLLLCLGLTGCGEILAGSYQVSSPHVDRPATAEDPSILRAENYRELVSAVYYFVSQGEESGVIQLYDYAGDVETDLTAACLEVVNQDPLGAYLVDYIKHELVRVVSYDQATLSIHYRRTMEQVRSMVNVTGTSAIRTELREALGSFRREVVLRVAYFDQDMDSITQLIHQVYYDNPVAALGFPQVEINLYPDSGRERVVEILLTYGESEETLLKKSQSLSRRAEAVGLPVRDMQGTAAAQALAEALWRVSDYDPQAPDTPYAALVEGAADDEGMTLAYLLLCQENGLSGDLIRGTLKLPAASPPEEGEAEGEAPVEEPQPQPRRWAELRLGQGGSGPLYLDLAEQGSPLYTAQELFDLGYRWPGGPQEPEPEPETEPGPEGEEGADQGAEPQQN